MSDRTPRALLLLALALALGGCTGTTREGKEPDTRPDLARDEGEIRALHGDLLRAHREADLAGWLSKEAEDYVQVNRGEITFPSKEDRSARLGPYLDQTTFTEYRDLLEPLVRISPDGMMGWLLCQVRIAGTRVLETGEAYPVDSVWAWIELYEKREGRWLRVGDVSNVRPGD